MTTTESPFKGGADRREAIIAALADRLDARFERCSQLQEAFLRRPGPEGMAAWQLGFARSERTRLALIRFGNRGRRWRLETV